MLNKEWYETIKKILYEKESLLNIVNTDYPIVKIYNDYIDTYLLKPLCIRRVEELDKQLKDLGYED